MSKTIAIIGLGNVGATIAYGLILQKLGDELLLIDKNLEKCAGELLDLQDVVPLVGSTKISAAQIPDTARADIIVICAGSPQKVAQPRSELERTNTLVIRSIIQELKPHLKPSAIIIMVTNPVDVMTCIAAHESGLPTNQVFGSGTLLDSVRLQYLLAEKFNVPFNQVRASVIGEHGDAQMVDWDDTIIAGEPSVEKLTKQERTQLAQKTRDKAYEIIRCKGATYYGVATCVAAYCTAIIEDSNQILPVSCFNGSMGNCESRLATIDATGARPVRGE